MSAPDFDIGETLDIARESALGQDWSKAVTFSRNAEFLLEKADSDSLVIRVFEKNKTLSTRVEIDTQAADWQVDCRCESDPCLHVLSALIAAKNKINFRTTESKTSAHLVYVLEIHNDSLQVQRYIEFQGSRRPFRGSLREYVGGLQSGRVSGANITPSKEDFAVEQATGKDGIPKREQAETLLRTLRQLNSVEFLGEAAQISDSLNECEILCENHQGGFRLRRLVREDERRLKNGFVVSSQRIISAAKEHEVDSSYLQHFSPEGKLYSRNASVELQTEILPFLSRFAQLTQEAKLPTFLQEEPYATFELSKIDEVLSVTPRILYGKPPVLEIRAEGPTELDSSVVVQRDLDAEKLLIRRLQSELHLQIGRSVSHRGEAAVRFAAKLKDWETKGEGVEAFSKQGRLVPKLSVSEAGLEVEFELQELDSSSGSSLHGETQTKRSAKVDLPRVLSSWERGEALVPLSDGGWAEIPKNWLETHGEQIKELLNLDRGEDGTVLEKHRMLLAEEGAALGAEVSSSLRSLKNVLLEKRDFSKQAPELPDGLQAQLRDYQLQGLTWLQQVRLLEAGAILADDMGLGKTLQVICILEGRSLVVAPTSVLDSWCEQLGRFRPGLEVCRYHGANREFSSSADVVITSFAILRREPETFSEEWNTLVVDEGQNIKNPDSATSQAVYSLSGNFRVSLSGTPVENKAEDLWSQFHFVFPELLGSRAKFEKQFARGLRRGERNVAERLRRRIAPFILRRKKQDVLQELPPKTEVVLSCELSETERTLYESVYLSSQETVRKALQNSSEMMAALEALLRLRQVCAHSALVPGATTSESSKCDLLLESLEISKEAGHRCLVFSQWTSMLDLIQERLEETELSFGRLDGSTKDRKKVIDEFQREDGPDLLLLSLKAGGVGITLTAADHIYLYDSWWNPAVEDQAADRAHRIGQSNPVLVHRLLAKDTVEEKVLELQEKKRELADNILSGEAVSKAGLTREDLEILFS